MVKIEKAMTEKPMSARLRGVRRSLRALTIWHPYGRSYANLRWWRQLLRAAFVQTQVPQEWIGHETISLIFTCDLELDPPWEGGSWGQRGLRGIEEGLPRLLDLLDAHKIQGTFFTEGLLASLAPEAVVEVARRGHEVGCHSLAHESHGGRYRVDETIPPPRAPEGKAAKEAVIRKAKDMLEELVGVPIRSFRAPFLHIDSAGSEAVADAGFVIDSSLQNHLFGYLSAPAHLDPGNPLSRTRVNGPPHRLIEIPVSVDPRPRLRSRHPYPSVDQGVQTRSVLQRIIAASALAGAAPTLVLLVHPWEFVEGFSNPFGQKHGTARAERFEHLLECLRQQGHVRSISMGAFASEWEQNRCPWHADLVQGKSSPPVEGVVN